MHPRYGGTSGGREGAPGSLHKYDDLGAQMQFFLTSFANARNRVHIKRLIAVFIATRPYAQRSDDVVVHFNAVSAP